MAEPETVPETTMSNPEPELVVSEPYIEPEAVQPSSEGEANPETEYNVTSEPEAEPEGEYDATAESEVIAEGEASGVVLWMYLWSYSLIIALILVLNGLIVAAVFKGKLHRRNAINIYLLSLVFSRMSIGVLVVPARITGLFSEAYLGSFLCKLCHYFAMGSGASSVFSTTAIAIVKFQEIVLKKGVITVTCKRALRDVIIIWFCGHMYALRAPFFNDLTVVRGFVSCAVTPEFRQLNNYFIFVDIFVLFLFPMTVIIYCYFKLVKFLNKFNEKQPLPTTPRGTPQSQKALTARDINMTDKASQKKVAWSMKNKRFPDSSAEALNSNQSNNVKIWRKPEINPSSTPVLDIDSDGKPVEAEIPEKLDEDVPNSSITALEVEAEKKKQNKRSVMMVITVMGLFVTCTILPYIPKLYAYWETDVFANFPIFETICYQISYSNAWINAVVIFIFRPDIGRMVRFLCGCGTQVESEVSMLDNRTILMRTD